MSVFGRRQILLSFCLTTALLVAIVEYNIFKTHDGYTHFVWGYYHSKQILEGQLYPKWFEEAFGGLGASSFTFYPPLFRFLSLPFALLNLSPSQQIKGAIIVVVIINSLGVFLLSYSLFKTRGYSRNVAVIFGTLNPYFLVDIFVRGAYAEATSIAILPWLMLSILKSLQLPERISLGNAIFLSLIFLSHIPGSLILLSSLFVGVSYLFVARKISLKTAINCFLLPLTLALGITSFFLLPVVMDNKLFQKPFRYDYENHFLDFSHELSYLLVGENFLIAILGISLYLSSFQYGELKDNPRKKFLSFAAAICLFSLGMVTPIAKPIYEGIKVFQEVQFPWRFFVTTQAIIPYLFAESVGRIIDENKCKKYTILSKIIPLVAITPLIMFCCRLWKEISQPYHNRFDKSFVAEINQITVTGKPTTYQEKNYLTYGEKYKVLPIGGRLFLFDNNFKLIQLEVPDYLPKGIDALKWPRVSYPAPHPTFRAPRLYPPVEIMYKGKYHVEAWKPGKRVLRLSLPQATAIIIKTFFYPGWHGEYTPLSPQQNNHGFIMTNVYHPLTLTPWWDGRIAFQLPPGEYQVIISYKGTLAERIGGIVTWITMSVIVFWQWRRQYKKKAIRIRS
ncbi:MAG TPA: hypothetical protein IGQ44_11055 [Geminocystis sp. M7585_C2015_104]|nr:hypothetical protein [Geminocystis sp. M7585_C2015_104]